MSSVVLVWSEPNSLNWEKSRRQWLLFVRARCRSRLVQNRRSAPRVLITFAYGAMEIPSARRAIPRESRPFERSTTREHVNATAPGTCKATATEATFSSTISMISSAVPSRAKKSHYRRRVAIPTAPATGRMIALMHATFRGNQIPIADPRLGPLSVTSFSMSPSVSAASSDGYVRQYRPITRESRTPGSANSFHVSPKQSAIGEEGAGESFGARRSVVIEMGHLRTQAEVRR